MKYRLVWTDKERYSGYVLLVLLVSLLWLYFPLYAKAQTYFVCDDGGDCNSGKGSGWSTGYDGNRGTSKSAPWKTVEHGASQLSAGDTLIVGDGTYTDHDNDGYVVALYNLTGSGWGEGTKQITIRAENKHGAKIGGNKPKKYTYGFIGISNAKFIWIEGFDIHGIHRGIHFNTLKSGQQENVYIKNCKIHDLGNFTETCEVIVGVRTPPGGANFTVDGCYFYNIGRLPGCRGDLHDYVHDHAVYAAGRGILVKNSIFRDITAGMSIKIDHHRGDKASGSEWTHRIINNTFHGDDNPIASGAITFFRNQEYRSYNVVIANNVFHQPSNNDGGQQDTAIVAGNLGSKTCPTDSHIDPNTTTIVNNVTNSEYLFAACENEIKASGVWSNNTALNNRSSDIGMIDPDNHDFRLTKDATFLVDKASDTYAPKYDYLGNARPYGNTDISAYEYGSGAREYPPEPPEGLRVLQ